MNLFSSLDFSQIPLEERIVWFSISVFVFWIIFSKLGGSE